MKKIKEDPNKNTIQIRYVGNVVIYKGNTSK